MSGGLFRPRCRTRTRRQPGPAAWPVRDDDTAAKEYSPPRTKSVRASGSSQIRDADGRPGSTRPRLRPMTESVGSRARVGLGPRRRHHGVATSLVFAALELPVPGALRRTRRGDGARAHGAPGADVPPLRLPGRSGPGRCGDRRAGQLPTLVRLGHRLALGPAGHRRHAGHQRRSPGGCWPCTATFPRPAPSPWSPAAPPASSRCPGSWGRRPGGHRRAVPPGPARASRHAGRDRLRLPPRDRCRVSGRPTPRWGPDLAFVVLAVGIGLPVASGW